MFTSMNPLYPTAAYQEDIGEGSALHLWVTATAVSRARTIRPAQYQRVVS